MKIAHFGQFLAKISKMFTRDQPSSKVPKMSSNIHYLSSFMQMPLLKGGLIVHGQIYVCWANPNDHDEQEHLKAEQKLIRNSYNELAVVIQNNPSTSAIDE